LSFHEAKTEIPDRTTAEHLLRRETIVDPSHRAIEDDERGPESRTDLSQLVSTASIDRLSSRAALEAELLHQRLQRRNLVVRRQFSSDAGQAQDLHARLSARAADNQQQLRALRPADPADAPVPVLRANGWEDLVRPQLGRQGEIVFGVEGSVALPRARNAASVRPQSPKTSGFIQVMLRENNGTIHFDNMIAAERPGNPANPHI
jgi:hypothetical protein